MKQTFVKHCSVFSFFFAKLEDCANLFHKPDPFCSTFHIVQIVRVYAYLFNNVTCKIVYETTLICLSAYGAIGIDRIGKRIAICGVLGTSVHPGTTCKRRGLIKTWRLCCDC